MACWLPEDGAHADGMNLAEGSRPSTETATMTETVTGTLTDLLASRYLLPEPLAADVLRCVTGTRAEALMEVMPQDDAVS